MALDEGLLKKIDEGLVDSPTSGAVILSSPNPGDVEDTRKYLEDKGYDILGVKSQSNESHIHYLGRRVTENA